MRHRLTLDTLYQNRGTISPLARHTRPESLSCDMKDIPGRGKRLIITDTDIGSDIGFVDERLFVFDPNKSGNYLTFFLFIGIYMCTSSLFLFSCSPPCGLRSLHQRQLT